MKTTEQDSTGVGSGAGVGASSAEEDDVPDSKTDQDILESPKMNPEDAGAGAGASVGAGVAPE